MSEERTAPQLTLKVAENAAEMFHIKPCQDPTDQIVAIINQVRTKQGLPPVNEPKETDKIKAKLHKIFQECSELQELIDSKKQELAELDKKLAERKKYDLEHPPLSIVIRRKNDEIRDLQAKVEALQSKLEDAQMKLSDFEYKYGPWQYHDWEEEEEKHICTYEEDPAEKEEEEPTEEEEEPKGPNLGKIIEELTAPDPAPEPKKRQKLIFCQYLREKDPSMKYYQSFVARWKKALKKAQEIGGDYEKEINQINLQSIRDLQGMQDTLITLDLKQRTSQLGDCINYLQKIMEETQK